MSEYTTIVKSTGLIGGVKIITIILGIIRTKIIALLIGSEGFGLFGLYTSATDLGTYIFSFGLNQSGVRQIAKSKGECAQIDSVNITGTVVSYSVFVSALFGVILFCLFSKQISISLFGTADHYIELCIISTVILFQNISNGQIAILNGLRCLKYMSVCQILGAILGTIGTILLIFFFNKEAIPYSIVLVSFIAMISSYYYLKKTKLRFVTLTMSKFFSELKELLSIGLSLSIAGGIFYLISYISKIYLRDSMGLSVVGIYQSCWTLSNLYIGLILSAMGVDFLPRIMGYISDKKKLVNSVNQQQEFGALVGFLGVIVTFLFSSLILNLFYSSEFEVGTTIIRWQILGVFLRVFSFPFGYVITGLKKNKIYIITQSLFYLLEYVLLIVCVNLFGLNGLGINYFLAYLLYFVASGFICYKLIDYKPSKLLQMIFLSCSFFLFLAVILVLFIHNVYLYYAFSVLLVSASIYYILYTLSRYMNIDVLKYINNKFHI